MDAPFPFGFPPATAFYLTLYVLTLVIHVVFMNYVLAGSAYLAAAAVLRGATLDDSPPAVVLRDWLPFMLSAAITAGIAPLLFLQVLFKQRFYTANLLLFHRWMLILPVLIGGFYLLYLLKSRLISTWPLWSRAVVGCGAFACFAFIGWSWTENHLLSNRPGFWNEHYASGTMRFRSPALAPRFALWFVGSFPTMTLVVGWQMWMVQRDAAGNGPGSKRTSLMALSGLLLSAPAAIMYLNVMHSETRANVTGPMAKPYLTAALIGWFVQTGAWTALFRRGQFGRGWLLAASAGLGLTLLGMTVVREAVRFSTIPDGWNWRDHAQAWQVGGFDVFVSCLLFSAVLIAYCIRLVIRGLRDAAER